MQRGVWKSLETSSLLAVIVLAGCEPNPGEATQASVLNQTESTALPMGAGISESQASLIIEDDVAYLAQIGLMRGHLWVGHQLYLKDLPVMAETHMKHPKAELYSTLVDAFEARGVAGFAEPLSHLADRVSARAPREEVQVAYDQLQAQIAACEHGANIDSPANIAKVIVALLRTAADEYAIGIVDGATNNLHEYQDAYGFTEIAKVWARSSAFSADDQSVAVAAAIQDVLDELAPMWPSLAPQGSVDFTAAQLYDAAIRIETLALNI
ncbi:MAG: hypothetical protein ACR2PZ_20345 [Pseudomonadales bacterium]